MKRGDTQASVNVIRTLGSDGQASIEYKTEPATATPGEDYISQSGTLNFADGETVMAIVIPLVTSGASQPNDEEFKVTIDNPIGAALLAPRTATIIILGDIQKNMPTPSPPSPTGQNINITPVDILTGIPFPTKVIWLPDTTMLIASKKGKVYVATGSTILPTPFIDISDIVNDPNDRELISIAVHPNFPSTPYVYLFFTYEGTDNVTDPPGTNAGPDGKGNRAGRLTWVTANAATNYRTHVPGSEVILIGKNSIRKYFNPNVDSTIDFNEPQGGFENGQYIPDFINSDSLSHTVGD